MWDDEESSFNDVPVKTVVGRGALTKVFGGTARGIGRGSVESGQSNGKNTAEDGLGPKGNGFGRSGFGNSSGFGGKVNDNSGGFGSGNRSGFGSRTNDDNSSSGFGGSGFGSRTNDNSSSGFGGKVNGNSGGFGGGSRSGFGSRTNDDNGSSSGGFGGGSRSGFGSRTNDDNNSSGFGGKVNGNSGGFGGGGRSGFGSRTDDDNSSSGFNGKSNGNSGGFGGFGSSRSHENDTADNDSGVSDSSRFGSRGGFRDSGSRGGAHGAREGNWTCPNSDCGNLNFAFRKSCQKCDTAKPSDSGSSSGFSGGRGGSRSDGGRNDRGGEWMCPDESCGNKNFAFRKNCQKCDTPKPETGDDANKSDKPREAPYVPPAPSDKEEDIFSGAVQKGINFDKYDDIPVEVSGRNQCGVISSFDEAGFYPTFLRNVKRANFEKPTPIQKYSVPIISAGRDLMACAQTGSGKTAAFLLPVLTAMVKNGLTTDRYQDVQTPQAICVAPTRELVLQIHNDCRKFAFQTDIKPVVVYGGTSLGHQMRQIESGANFVTGTPGRLLDIINRGKISLKCVSFLILDEADRMLDMGFEPEIRKLVETLGMPPKTERQTLMFSATFPEEIQKLAADFLNDYLFVTVGRVGGANTDVSQNFFEVERLQKRDSLCDILNAGGGEKTLVFVEMKRNADFLASFLCQTGFPTTSIHGDRLQQEREEALRDFKSGKAHVLVATSVAARGLDIPEVKHVINYDLPASIDEYVHRIGRTGRCGNLGKATSFYSSDTDQLMAPHLVRILKEARQPVPDWLAANACGMGAGDTGSFGGRFGGKDIRREKFGGGGRAHDNSGDNWAAGTGAECDTACDDENWD